MRRPGGFSVAEMMATIAISAVLFGALYQLTAQSMAVRSATDAANESLRDLQFAMDRMVRTASEGRLLLLPLDTTTRDLFAVTLPASVDFDGNGIPDADNDGDGRVDEDPGGDTNNDGFSGLEGIDDDGDGSVDENTGSNEDESGLLSVNEDSVNGIDDDGDGAIDEDPGGDLNGDGQPGIAGVDDDGDGMVDEGSALQVSDDDEDGSTDEDWYEPVVFRLVGSTLIERMPQPWDVRGGTGVNGRDWSEYPILENVSVFQAQRISTSRYEVVDLTLTALDANGEAHTLQTRVRVGGAL